MEDAAQVQLDLIFYYGAYPLWRFLDHVFDLDIREVCQRVALTKPILKTQEGSYRICAVDDDYDGQLYNNVGLHGDHCTFLLNCVNVVFNSLKNDTVKLRFKESNDAPLDNCVFQLDDKLNMELICGDVPLEGAKLGIIYTPLIDEEEEKA